MIVITPSEVTAACQSLHSDSECTLFIGVHAAAKNSTFSLTGSVIEYGAGFVVDNPSAIAGPRLYQPALFGAMLPAEGTTTCAVVASPENACNELTNADAISGCIAIVERGPFTTDCPFPNVYFANKVLVAQRAGATAVIVTNIFNSSSLVGMSAVSGDAAASVAIPSVFVSRENGEELKSKAAAGLYITLSRHFSRAPSLLDGMPMRGIIGHNMFVYCVCSPTCVCDCLALCYSSAQHVALFLDVSFSHNPPLHTDQFANPSSATDVYIMVTKHFGNPDLYVTASTRGPNQIADSYPSTSQYTWRAVSTESHDMIRIPASDPNRCVSA